MVMALHRVPAGRLAELDPELAHLADALHAGMARSDWQLHDVRWTPGERCRLAFAVGESDTPTTFVAVNVTPDGVEELDYRSDPALPGLPEAADPVRVVQLIAPHVGHAPTGGLVQPVRYRPGSRCVLRYRFDGAGTGEIFAKVLPHRARLTAAAWQVLADDGRGNGAAPLVPPYIGEWHDHDVILAGAVRGRSVSSLLGGHVASPESRARLGARLGVLLARLHRHRDVEAPTRTADDQLAALDAMLPVARRVDAVTATRLAVVVDTLRDHRPAPGPAVLAHGGFRAGQCVVTADGALVLLDLDGLHYGDAARDVATALAHFVWQEVKHPALRPAMGEVADAFLGAYQHRAGTLPADSLAWWRAAALAQLVGRRYRRLEISEWPLLPSVVEVAESLLPRSTAPRGAASPMARPASLLEAVRDALQQVAAVPEGVAVEMTEVLGASTRRMVHEYVVRGLDGPGAVTVIAKSFNEPGRAELVHEHLRVLAEDVFPAGELRVPAPLALVPDLHLVLFRGDAGSPLDRIEDLDRATAGARGAARWLARLHTSAVTLPRRMDLDREVTTTREWAAVIGEHHPELMARAGELADLWRGALRPVTEAWVPIHKDFHAGHVLVGEGDDVCVIDLDEARVGDAALDVAHFVTYLELRHPPVTAAALADAFLAEYTSASGRVRDVAAGYVAYTWLKIAKQWAAGRVHGRDADVSRRRRGVDEALTRGLACLGG